MDSTKASKFAYYHAYNYSTIQRTEDAAKMHGARRVITFCLLTAVIPTILIVIPLYLRHHKYADVTYTVSESDVVQIHDGQSTIFCQKHSLTMNTTFNAFQMKGTPEISNSRKHIRLKKSISLPDDTLEYWGFYLLKGATVELKVCSRYKGARILVVKGQRNLQTCGLLQKQNKVNSFLAEGQGKVIVTFDSPAELVDNVNHPKLSPAEEKESALNNAAEQTSAEVDETDRFSEVQKLVPEHVSKLSSHHHVQFMANMDPITTVEKSNKKMKKNNELLSETLHSQKRIKRRSYNGINLDHFINSKEIELRRRLKRKIGHTPHHILDRGINHGGNAGNKTNGEDSSVSSFENSLLECYNGNVLLNNEFPPSHHCTSVHFLEKNVTTMKTVHEVVSDGYYYYIFFSDNDMDNATVHAIFDIYKPTFQYANISESKTCINKTECSFPVMFMSHEGVIVEVPTRDGIEHEGDDITLLTSTCHPRMSVYVIFPITVLVLILICAFL